ncbi:alpha/beta hydrolase family protein [Flaviflexus huanghaiensis]|uniref:alpha/beta hydrolase family protein n=1 Tax=Flaviflexus huanghaiensis TaxID=1111473 RepID=UPI0015F9FCA7|nr:alpha/beta fold hydrolase [Flaviflexus huanghaiensis]
MSSTTPQQIYSSLDDFVSTPRVTGMETRHGRSIASVATISDKLDSYSTRLVEVGQEPVPLTRAKKGESLAAIGERGEIYFTSKRDDDRSEDEGTEALWMLPPHGEARVVLRRPGGVDGVIAAGGRLFIVASSLETATNEDEHAEVSKKRKERGVSAILHESFPVRYWDHDHGPAYSRLYEATLPSLDGDDDIELTPVEVPAGRLESVEVSDDGSALLVTMEETTDGTVQWRSVYLIRDGKTIPFALAPAISGEEGDRLASYRAGAFSPSGDRAIIHVSTANRDGHPLRNTIEIADVATAQRHPLSTSFDDWPSEAVWLDQSTLIMTADRRGRASLYRVDVGSGEHTLLTEDDDAYHDIGVCDGVIFCLQSAIDQPSTPVTVDPVSGDVTALPRLTPEIAKVGRLTEVTATGEDGTQVRAWLALPESDEPAPLAVFVHGGPWGSWNDWTWRWNPGPFVARGYAVLLPDPAISTGYGQAMIDRGNDELGGVPCTDILALVDAAEARDDISGEKTALLGGSYGGYMANWMAGHTGDRFSCIVTHASLWNVDMMGRTTDNGEWHEWMSPTQAGTYSPHAFAEQIEVPMLVIHGDKDYRVPVSQSHALWHSLLRYSKADGHRFLYYPDENHWILKPSNSAVWYETVLAFLDTHVRGADWKRPELLG